MKKFTVTGLCIPKDNYMCDTTEKFNRCKYLSENGYYYAINFPRQFGKTTMQYLLDMEFSKNNDYFVISTSFEGIGDDSFKSEKALASSVLIVFAKSFRIANRKIAKYLKESANSIKNINDLSEFISDWIYDLDKKVVLLIDEVDKASNNQTFISFLAMLRDKYLDARKKRDIAFHSVILLGVHDVKSLKLKLRPKAERKLNSPWNISENLDIDFAFSPKEIKPMLDDYAKEHNFSMDTVKLSEKLYYYTSGHPFLISLMCKTIDEKLLKENPRKWKEEDIDNSYKYINELDYTTTNFDDMYKNLENNKDLFNLVYNIVIQGESYNFNIGDPVIIKGKTFGILSKNAQRQCDISNKIYEYRIIDYMLSKQQTNNFTLDLYNTNKFIENNRLNITLILEKFQLFMKEHNSSKDNSFLEKNGRLLLMSFLRPIINGRGFMFKENVTTEDRKMDLVVTFNDNRYVIELKIWYGEKYLTDGLKQLADYLDSYSLDTGYMLIYNFNKNKKYEIQRINKYNKDITAVFV